MEGAMVGRKQLFLQVQVKDTVNVMHQVHIDGVN
jgi:hypothetical protein